MRPLTRERAGELIEELTVENDGQYAPALLELINGIHNPDNVIAIEVMNKLYAMTQQAAEGLERFLVA